jgi:hypothetical protein
LAIQSSLWLEADRHTSLSGQVDDFLETAVGSSLNDEDPFDGSGPSFETFENRMDAEDDLHGRRGQQEQ